MSRTAQVVSSTRVSDVDGHGLDVTVDPGGGDATTVSHYASSGDDAPALASDFCALTDASGTGAENVVGYADVKNAGKAAPGEKRIYARKPDGSVTCDIWLKGDETIVMTFGAGGSFECKANGDVVINGVTISKLGAITARGEVTANAATIPVKLAGHTHLTAGTGAPVGPTPFPVP
jgi:hypothetical protein